MQAYPRPLRALFDGNYQYAVPIFQRRYVWNQDDQWEPLWKDVQRVADRALRGQFRPHFLGAVVLKQANHSPGTVDQWELIDGQQRLTTLQLLLAAARDAGRCVVEDAGEVCDAFDLLTRNSMVRDRSLDVSFKVLPSKHDREYYRKVVRAGSEQAVKDACDVLLKQPLGREIPEAYLFFSGQITDWLNAGNDHASVDKLVALQEALFNGLHLVVIDLDPVDDAQVIFETLNTRGADLLAADLVKNYLLDMAVAQRLNVEQCYEAYWEVFDTDDFWRQKVSQGRFFRPRADVFLQHYLMLHLREEVAADNLFASYQDYALNGGGGKAEDLLASLRCFGDIFRSFYSDTLQPAEGLFFSRLAALDTTTAFPFLLDVYNRLSKHSDAAARQAILWDLESYLIRRMVCGLTTKNYNKVFIELIANTHGEGSLTPQRVREFLLSKAGDSDRWPSDEEFHRAWLEQPLYRKLTRGRLRMVLEALEVGVRTRKHEQTPVPKRLTVEHLMPQAWQENWPLPRWKANAKEDREGLIHTIGNLTLLTESLNPDISNSAWSKKRPKIRKYSLLALNHYFDDRTEWDEAAIRERGVSLFTTAVKIWPRPG